MLSGLRLNISRDQILTSKLTRITLKSCIRSNMKNSISVGMPYLSSNLTLQIFAKGIPMLLKMDHESGKF